MHWVGRAGKMDSEIKNAGPDPQASLPRENRFQDCGEHQAAAKGVAVITPKNTAKPCTPLFANSSVARKIKSGETLLLAR